MRLVLHVCAVVAFALVLSFTLRAQQPPPAAANDERDQTIRVDVDLVNILFTVKDKKGRLVNTLTKEDFEIHEDGHKQQIRYFSRETDLPLTIGLLIDTSPSQWRLVDTEKDAAEVFLRRVLRAKDLAFLFSFDFDVELLQDLTGNLELMRRGLELLRANAPVAASNIPVQGPFPGVRRGGTLLHDAVYLAAREKLATEVGRKAIVLISDGEDQGSKMKLEEAVEAAQKADVIVYSLLFADREFYHQRGAWYTGEGSMKKLAEETGGRLIRVDRMKDLPAAFEEIAQELRSQYSIGYVSTDQSNDNRFRKLRIKANGDDLKVQARKGYYKVKSE